MIVKALSLWEPWASLMRTGAKTIETRSWYTNYRGPLLICSAKRFTAAQAAFMMGNKVQEGLAALRRNGTALVNPSDLQPFGRALALVDLVGCHSTEALFYTVPKREKPLGDFSPDRFAWETDNLRTFEPFPVKGSQGLFEVEVPPGLLEKGNEK